MKRAKIKSLDAINKQVLKSRINIIMLIIFILFLILIIRLGYLQIVLGDTYQEQVENAQYVEINQSVPRGEIYDRNGNLLVGNTAEKAVYFTRHRNMSNFEIMDVAETLSTYIDMDTESLSLRDKQDYIINNYPKELSAIMPEQVTLLENGGISQNDFNEDAYNIIDEEFADSVLSDEDLNIIAVYVEMVSASELNPVIIKSEDVTEEEFAKVNEDLDQLTGISTGLDWQRDYPYDSALRTVLGEVSTNDEGLPRELVEYYQALGYSRNDRVGKSYLEFQYEDVLRGKKPQVKYTTDKSGRVTGEETIKEGKAGDDLYLTIDIELQLELEKIAEHHLTGIRELAEEIVARDENSGDIDYTIIPEYIDTVQLVVQDPNNGDILAMVGKHINEDGDIVDYDYGTLTATYVPGSSVKGATVATGYQEDVLEVGETLIDEPMTFSGTDTVSSFFNRNDQVPVDDQRALMVSSNTYMFKIALAIMGEEYSANMPLPTDVTAAGYALRNGLNQFGLGVSTGIDLPNEARGLAPQLTNPMNYLYLSIGQYDTYSALQLSQYMSTFAADGKRVQQHLAKEIRGSDANDKGPILKSYGTNVLNTIPISDSELSQIQAGFYDVFNTHDQGRDMYGTGWDAYHELEPKAAGKTGTAESFRDGDSVLNQTYLGYAPYDNPDMAFSIIFPTMPSTVPFFPAQFMGQDVIQKYYEIYYGQAEESLYNYDASDFYSKLEYGQY
ncbi:penicillin-binding protein 2 [Jeotgalicoccus halotolerans]|uniref:Penicillin-binding protein 3 n=2 Tax=Jeotgalicoccus halotolerans TaxID=157227 RepID=A0A3E0B155_9STAP|nr:penicillin-binding protein 2 [Jeotgalicoccus halotolerans]REG25703.1 penicillin-binding protein 3 [Jeotgalicoccus halotolerans]